MERELVVLGTASRAPTRRRNHNGYLLRWDGRSILFDPGEGTQRQVSLAGASLMRLSRICLTHFHGDHVLGLPGVLLRLSLDESRPPIPIHYPGGGQVYFERLCGASAGPDRVPVEAHPVAEPGVIYRDDDLIISCAWLSHRVETIGYRVEEPAGRNFVPELLDAHGVKGADIGRLQETGSIVCEGRVVHLEEVTELHRGQVFAHVMDTAWCDGALTLAAGADLLLCESTFLSEDEDLAREYGHLTARQAGRLARVAGARRLVLSHFSRRYDDSEAFGVEARHEFDDVVVAEDFDRIPVPPREVRTD